MRKMSKKNNIIYCKLRGSKKRFDKIIRYCTSHFYYDWVAFVGSLYY